MNKAYKLKLLYIFGISLIFYLVGCVDTSVENIPQQLTYKSMVRFVNDADTTATVNIDGGQVATLESSQTSGYSEINSGSRNISATYASGPNVQQTLSMDTDSKITVTIIQDTSYIVQGEDTVGFDLVRSFKKSVDGYIF